VEAEGSRLLIDAGFSGAQMSRRLAQLDVDPASIDLVVVTHEHRDHTSGIGVGARRWGWTLAMNPATRRACAPLLKGAERSRDLPSRGLRVGALEIEPVHTCHDAADPVAIVVHHSVSALSIGIATDLGRATVPVRQALKGCAFLVLEANHDERMLRAGPYPWRVKQRIGGSRGHLSNRLAAELARDLVHPGLEGILLAHLSAECNDPAVAADRVAEGLFPTRFDGTLACALQDEPSERFDVGTRSRVRATHPQMSLFEAPAPKGA